MQYRTMSQTAVVRLQPLHHQLLDTGGLPILALMRFRVVLVLVNVWVLLLIVHRQLAHFVSFNVYYSS
jgi:hypothetical protein